MIAKKFPEISTAYPLLIGLTSMGGICSMAQPGPVVHQALKDSRKRKELSIYGLPMKLTYAGTKLLPHKLLLRIQNL